MAPLLLAAAAVAVLAITFLLGFPERTDYVGHFTAGAGGTLGLLGLVLVRPGRRPSVVVITTIVAIFAGVGTEATIFRLAIFDPVDVANQSLGAAVVGTALTDADGSVRLGVGALVVAAVLLVVGFRFAFA